MAKNRKRREIKKTPPHQQKKASVANAPKKTNWIQIAAITIGILIVVSMVLSMFVIPGSF